ncbi:MAG: uL15m family ribosomal protein [Candidatus Woesearchaeota archaeon]
MSAYKKKRKVQRLRGSKTHGWGAMKKHRGAGHRGGRGNAGSGKRGDAKKPSYWKNEKKKGFVSVNQKKRALPAINLSTLDRLLPTLLSEKKVRVEQGFYVVDLSSLGYGKLLGSGNTTHKYKITVMSASKRGIEKVKAQGGDVVVLRSPEEGQEPHDDTSLTDEH